MRRWLKRAWGLYKESADIIDLLQTVGAWKWIVVGATYLVSALLMHWSQLPLWAQFVLSLVICCLLLFITGFAMALWKTRNSSAIPSEKNQIEPQGGSAATAAPRSPEKQFRLLARTLEAVVESPLSVNRSGSILVSVSLGSSSELEPILSMGRYSTITWGELERSDCEVPFLLSIQQEYLPSLVELHLVTADFQAGKAIRMDLNWNTRSRPVEFLVKPLIAGIHKAQIQLWAHRKWQGSVFVQSTAMSETAAEAAGAGGLEMIASVDVKLRVVGYDQSIRQGHEQSVEPPGHGYSIGG